MARDGIEPPTHGASTIALPTELPSQIAGAGFEPTTFGLWSPTSYLAAPSRDKIKEDVGFEPTHAFTSPDGFQDRSLQPDLGNPPNNINNIWTLVEDSNPRPLGYEPSALKPVELKVQVIHI